MSGQKWTKEPLEVVDCSLGVAIRPVGTINMFDRVCDDERMTRANADRIVACWNGCKGLNPEAFAECVKQLEESQAMLAEGLFDNAPILKRNNDAIANARKVSA